jgi:hypothetical protein
VAQTASEISAEIARTRSEMELTMHELSARVDATKRRIPLYGVDRHQLLVIGGTLGAMVLTAFVALQVRTHMTWDPIDSHQRWQAARNDYTLGAGGTMR